jgi:hypothetical protein
MSRPVAGGWVGTRISLNSDKSELPSLVRSSSSRIRDREEPAMPATSTSVSPTEAFYDKLRRTGRVPALARVSGSMRIELTDGRKVEKTRIDVVRGQITVSESAGEAKCLVYTHRDVFDALCTREAHPMSAYLRGAVVAKGDAAMLVLMRRLFAVAGVPELAGGRSKLIAAPPGTVVPISGPPETVAATDSGARATRRVTAKTTKAPATKSATRSTTRTTTRTTAGATATSTAKRATATKSTAAKSTAAKSTAAKSTAARSTAGKSTAAKSTAAPSAAVKSAARKTTAQKTTARTKAATA